MHSESKDNENTVKCNNSVLDYRIKEVVETFQFDNFLSERSKAEEKAGVDNPLIKRLSELAYSPTNKSQPTFVNWWSPTASGKTVSSLKDVCRYAKSNNSLAIFFTEYTANYQQEAKKLMHDPLYEGIRNDAIAIDASLSMEEIESRFSVDEFTGMSDTSIIIITPDMFQKFYTTLVDYIQRLKRQVVAFVDEAHVIPQQSQLRECFSLLSVAIRDYFDAIFYISATPDDTLNRETARLLKLSSYTTIKCVRKRNIEETVIFNLRAVQPNSKSNINYPYLQLASYVVNKLESIYSVWQENTSKAREILLVSVMDRAMHYKITRILQDLGVLKGANVESFTGDRTKKTSDNILNLSKDGMLGDNVFLAFVTSVLHQAQSIDSEGLRRYCIYPMRIDRDIAADENRQVISRGRRVIKDGGTTETEVFLHRAFLVRKPRYHVSEEKRANYVRKQANESDRAMGIDPNEETDNEIKALIGKAVNQNNPFEVAYWVRRAKLKHQTFGQYLQEFSSYYPDQSKIIFKFRKLDGSELLIRDRVSKVVLDSKNLESAKCRKKEAVRDFDLSEIDEYLFSTSEDQIRSKVRAEAEERIPNYAEVLDRAKSDWEDIEADVQDEMIKLWGDYRGAMAMWIKETAKDYKTTGFIDKSFFLESEEAAFDAINFFSSKSKWFIDVFIKESLKLVSLWGQVDFDFAYRIYKDWRNGDRDDNLFSGIEQVQQAVRMSDAILLRLLLVNDNSVSNKAYQFANKAITEGSKRLKVTMQTLTDVALFFSGLQDGTVGESFLSFDYRESVMLDLTERKDALLLQINEIKKRVKENKHRHRKRDENRLKEVEKEYNRIKKQLIRRRKDENSDTYSFFKISEMFSEAKETISQGGVYYLEHTTLDMDKFRTLLKFTDAKLRGDEAGGRTLKQGEFCIVTDLKFDIARVSKDLGTDLEKLFYEKYTAALKKAIKRLETEAQEAGKGEKQDVLKDAIRFITEGLEVYSPNVPEEKTAGDNREAHPEPEVKHDPVPGPRNGFPSGEFADTEKPGEIIPNKDVITDIPIKESPEPSGVPEPINKEDIPF